MKTKCPSCQQTHLSSQIPQGDSSEDHLFCSSCGAPITSPVYDANFHGIDPGELIMRGIESVSVNPGEWDPLEVDDLSATLGERYEARSLIGKGGMGAVYLVWDKQLSRFVAMKILPLELLELEEAIVRFEREARAMASLDHPSILKIFDYGQTADGFPYLIMEYVEGVDLQHLLASDKVTLAEALKMLSQVCAGLEHAHQKGVIHRDIKPSNILIDGNGNAKVADFGLAKFTRSELLNHDDPKLTMTGQVMGTPEYMAPEQQAGKVSDQRSDIFSIGAMLFRLLTGKTPTPGWLPPSQQITTIDTRLDDIVQLSLQVSPEARYQSVVEQKLDIDAISSQTGGAALPLGVTPEPLPSSQNREMKPEDLPFKQDVTSDNWFTRIFSKR